MAAGKSFGRLETGEVARKVSAPIVPPKDSGDTTPCKVTAVILHGVVSPDWSSYTGLYPQKDCGAVQVQDALLAHLPCMKLLSKLRSSPHRGRCIPVLLPTTGEGPGTIPTRLVARAPSLGSSCPFSHRAVLSHRMYSSISFRKSTPPQNRQLKILLSNCKHQVEDLVGESTF